MTFLHQCLFIILNLAARTTQTDPIKDFCRRWGHQTAQIDGRLYIDGGMVNYNPPGLNYSNPSLLFSDLRTPPPGGDLNMPTQYANLSKNGTLPSVLGGYLWADETNKCFYQVGGEYPPGVSPTDFSLYTYDVVLNQWNASNYTPTPKSLQRVSFGAGTQVESRGLGFYFGGWLNERTTPGWKGAPIATNGLLQFDFSNGKLANNSGPDDGIGRAEGQMVYLPRSDGGLLVYFGGIEDPSRNGSYVPANMTKILIYDIASGRWYNQTASGQPPPSRKQFCAAVTSADDSSSFNIYIYGGYGFSTPAAYNDVYVLSLPSFTWIRVYPLDGTDVGDYGHGGCSANIINRNQMIVMGGWFPKETSCDAEKVQGQHNMILGNNTVNKKMWDSYDPKFTPYAVPEAVVSVIGGGPTGGATVRSPATWDHANLRTYYTLAPSFTARAATRALPATSTPSHNVNPPKKTNVGAIAGGVVGGLAVLILMLCLILFCLHRRKKAVKAENHDSEPDPPPAELAVTPIPHEMSNSTANKYVAAHERQASYEPAIYSPVQNRTTSYDQASAHSGYLSQSYHSKTTTPVQYGNHDFTDHASSPQAEYLTHSEYATQSPQQGMWNQQAGLHPTSPQQQQYSYPSPTSPQHTSPVQQSQVYYPPPEEPKQRSQHARSPSGTQYSGETQHPSPNASNMTTPAQFYAQPAQYNAATGFSGR